MFLKKSIYIFTLFISINNHLFCDVKINGQVISAQNNQPIQNVNVFVSNQKSGTTSDSLGNFELVLLKDSIYSIEFSHIAYEDKFIETKSEDILNIKMKEVFLMLDDIVVSSMKCEYALSDVPVYSEIIGKNKIIETGSVSVSDLLQQHAGISKVYNSHGTLDFNLMGLDSKYVLVLKNGKPIAGKFQDRIDLDQIMVSNVDKIEIVKGPGSSLHGSDAIGGVINIITKEVPEQTEFGVRIKRSLFDISENNDQGQSAGNLLSFNLTKKYERFSIGSTALFHDLSNQASINPLNKDKIRKVNYDGEIHWMPKNGINELGLMIEYFNQIDNGREVLSTGYELSSNNTDIKRSSITLDHKVILSDNISFNHIFSKSDYSREYSQSGIDSTFLMNNTSEENVFDYDGTLLYEMTNNNLLLGFDLVKPAYTSQRLNDTTHILEKSGFFIQNEYIQNDNFKMVVGFRRDNYQMNYHNNPRIALMYSPSNNYKMRFSIGRGFRAPSALETFIDFHNIDQGYIVKGNPSLRPEKSLGTSMNIEFSNKRNLRLNGLVYHNDFKDKILTEQRDEFNSSPTVFTYKNISSATYRGVELFADYVYSNALTLKFNINLRDDFDDDGIRLESSMPYSTNFELNFLIEALKTRIHIVQSQNYRYSTDTSFGLLNILLHRKLTKHIKINAGIRNITNYRDKINGPFKGRSVYLGISRH